MDCDALVSVIMPVLDAAAFLGEAIDSVLAQTYDLWELLLVDDGSGDGSLAIAASYAARDERIRLLRHPDASRPHGASASRNLALAQAKGELVAFLDGDDVWLPDNLASQTAALCAAPEVGVLYSQTLYWYSWSGAGQNHADYVAPHLVPAGRSIEGASLLALCLEGKASVPCTCSMLVRRSLIEAVGGFEEQFRQLYTDQALYAKLFLASSALPIEGCWARYRQHRASSTRAARREGRARKARLAFLTWLEEYLSRQPSVPPGLEHALRRETWRCHHPVADYLLDQVTFFQRDLRRVMRRD